MLAVGAHVRFLQNHAGLVESLFAIEHERFGLAREVHRKHLPCAAKYNRLAIGPPGAPCGVVHHLARVLARDIDHPQVPLFGIVRVVFRNPAALAAIKKHRRTIRRDSREPVHVVATRKRTGIAAVGVHNPDIVMRIRATRRPDNGPFELALEGRKCLLLVGSRINSGTRRSSLLGKNRSHGKCRTSANLHKLFHALKIRKKSARLSGKRVFVFGIDKIHKPDSTPGRFFSCASHPQSGRAAHICPRGFP